MGTNAACKKDEIQMVYVVHLKHQEPLHLDRYNFMSQAITPSALQVCPS